MTTYLKDLITDLQTDFGSSLEDLDEIVAERAIIRALALVCHDIEMDYIIENLQGNKIIKPEMTAFHRELLLLRSLIYLVRIKKHTDSYIVSFKSGDKQVQRQAGSIKELQKSLLDEYFRLVKKESSYTDNNILKINVKPARYSRGFLLE